MAGQPFTAEMRGFVELHQLGEVVFEVQQCSNEQLRAFYSAAQVTVFPSLAEGFGWPVVEAQACGCRVVTSDFAPLTEIGGDAAIYCDPRDEAKVAQEIASLLDESQEDRAARIAAGLNNAEQFSAEKMMSRYLDLYHTVAQS